MSESAPLAHVGPRRNGTRALPERLLPEPGNLSVRGPWPASRREREDGRPARLPRHLAIVMDGNGRWARRRRLPRIEGHRAGAAATRACVRACAETGIECLTLFAFSSENWARPSWEVEQLLGLFGQVLEKESDQLVANGVNLRFIGDRRAFPDSLQRAMEQAERHTAGNRDLVLVIAANYGGHWDIVNATRRIARAIERGELSADEVDRRTVESELALAGLPSPDLLVRTGGEQRISNFLLWDLAYTELYFVDTLWPEFDRDALRKALDAYAERERRFGRTSEQIASGSAEAAGAR